MVFLLLLLDDRRIRSRSRTSVELMDPEPGGPKTNGSGSATLVPTVYVCLRVQDVAKASYIKLRILFAVTTPFFQPLLLIRFDACRIQRFAAPLWLSTVHQKIEDVLGIFI